jgi:hypothetical protein
MKASQIAAILKMSADGMTPDEIAEELYQNECDTLAADAEDDSDEAIERRYCISADDRFDSRGEALRPRIDPESGEPWWM